MVNCYNNAHLTIYESLCKKGVKMHQSNSENKFITILRWIIMVPCAGIAYQIMAIIVMYGVGIILMLLGFRQSTVMALVSYSVATAVGGFVFMLVAVCIVPKSKLYAALLIRNFGIALLLIQFILSLAEIQGIDLYKELCFLAGGGTGLQFSLMFLRRKFEKEKLQKT